MLARPAGCAVRWISSKNSRRASHTVIGTKGVYLSGGEQQRIAIARAMLKNAPILILDEATAFADPDNEAKVQAAFAELSKGKTVIMIAHRLSTVVNADRIYVVKDGRIAESGHAAASCCARDGLFAQDVAGLSALGAAGRSQRRRNRCMKKLCKEHTPSPSRARGDLVKGVLACAVQNIALHAAREPAVCARPGPDGRRRCGTATAFYVVRLRRLLCADPAHDVVPVQRHLLCHLCGERRAPHRRLAEQLRKTPAVLLREEATWPI